MHPNDDIADPESVKYKSRLINHTNNAGIEYVEITVPLKYLADLKCR